MVISHTFLGLNNLILMLFISFYSFSIISILGNNIKGKTHNYHPLKLKEYFITFDDLQSMKKKYTLYSIDQYYDIYLCNTNYKYFAQILQKMVSGGNYDA